MLARSIGTRAFTGRSRKGIERKGKETKKKNKEPQRMIKEQGEGSKMNNWARETQKKNRNKEKELKKIKTSNETEK